MLGWNSTPVAFTSGLDLYRISHPNFGAQVFSHHRVDTAAGICGGWPRGERIYSQDIEGAIDGGSSGAPVVNGAGQRRSHCRQELARRGLGCHSPPDGHNLYAPPSDPSAATCGPVRLVQRRRQLLFEQLQGTIRPQNL
jgi:hypothetical protein